MLNLFNISFAYNAKSYIEIKTNQLYIHTVYPVTPNAGMFYQRGYKQLQNIRRGKNASIDLLLFFFFFFFFFFILV